ncbi:Tetraacyldisaccharide 4'-kinase [hydrothermal vent metagenome]|uniref:tetraacyldisaccharide 4'-kinase n=1 Tax=hydrothermal vent metagenome TaxID=652676 RepID=A0A3B0ZRG6_9ZZZZ
MSKIEQIWYNGGIGMIPLLPLSWLFHCLIMVRRWLYQHGWLTVNHFSAPLIVVGNITVGGVGKTPFVIWLANFLRTKGYTPGIVSRGYGGDASAWPQAVMADSNPALVGDEAVLLAQRCDCPVVVSPNRSDAVRMLLNDFDCDIVIADDGLQHYAMGRDIEIVIIDGQRRFGNGQLLPAGPLREPVMRLKNVDLCLVNGESLTANEYRMTLGRHSLYNLQNPEQRDELSALKGKKIHAIAGIGHPDKFFNLLKDVGIEVIAHPFPDHHAYSVDDLNFADDKIVVMTEKDAVKCASFAKPEYWVLAIEMMPEKEAEERLSALLITNISHINS